MSTHIQSANIINSKQLKENGGVYILQSGTITRVRLLMLNEIPDDGVLSTLAVPIYVVNKDMTWKGQSTIEAEAPIVMRAVMDKPTTGYIAIPVYLEEA